MENRQEPPLCPACARRLILVTFEPPTGLGDALAGLPELPDMFHCPECIVEATRGNDVVECPKLFLREGDRLRVAPDVVQWIVAEWEEEE